MPLKVIARKSTLHGMGLFAARDLAVPTGRKPPGRLRVLSALAPAPMQRMMPVWGNAAQNVFTNALQ